MGKWFDGQRDRDDVLIPILHLEGFTATTMCSRRECLGSEPCRGLLALAELKQAIEHLDADVIGILQPHIFAA